MGASSLFLSFFVGIVITSTLSSFTKTSFEMNKGSAVPSDQQSTIPSVETIVDSRFKLLASDFQDQINDLKGKVVKLEVSKTANVGVFEHHHEIQKRQTNTTTSTRPFCNQPRNICENSSSLCTFFYPDHPDASRKKGSYSSTVTNEMLQDPTVVKGVPSSCKELQLLGHKLNGLYLIQTSQSNQVKKIETVFCDFQSSTGLNVSQNLIGKIDVKTKSVHFYVQRNSSFSGATSVLPFELARLNEGEAFDLSSGVFTVPVAGIYHFDFSVVKDDVYQVLGIQLQVNGVVVGNAYTHQGYSSSSKQMTTASLSSSLRLKVNDKVTLLKMDGGLVDNEWHQTHFTGWLVEEDLNMK